nr:MAG TPA: Minor capsid protein [Caudoviricetes sp.]
MSVKQPKDEKYAGAINVTLHWNPQFAKNANEKAHQIQCVIDKAVIKYMTPYIPYQSGFLATKALTAETVIGSGKIRQLGPYAHYLYAGEIYGPNIPVKENGVIVGWWSPPSKTPTGRPLTYDTTKNPLAGSHWFERMKADHADDILREAQEEADK